MFLFTNLKKIIDEEDYLQIASKVPSNVSIVGYLNILQCIYMLHFKNLTVLNI